MTPINEKRVNILIEKANHRHDWYAKAYSYKNWLSGGQEASKRWWEALVGEWVRRGWDFDIEDILVFIRDNGSQYNEAIEKMAPYILNAKKRWSL
jgi:hypothetical protein